jgi:hypothetical protein
LTATKFIVGLRFKSEKALSEKGRVILTTRAYYIERLLMGHISSQYKEILNGFLLEGDVPSDSD